MADQRNSRWRYLITAGIVLAVFLFVSYFVYHELKTLQYAKIVEAIESLPAWKIGCAIFLTAINYMILVGYDWQATRIVGHKLPLKKIWLASFIAYAASFNFGPIFGGTAVRYRLYSGWGLSTLEIAKLVTVLTTTFWLGVIASAGVCFVLESLPIPPEFHLPIATTRPLGVVLLVLFGSYLLGTMVWRKPFRPKSSWLRALAGPDSDGTIQLPHPSTTLLQVAIASADMILAAGALYVLLPEDANVAFPVVLTIYLLAVVAVVFTHVPGGVGILELVILKLVPAPSPDELVGSLLVFRAIYYLLPLMLAAIAFAGHELKQRAGLWKTLELLGSGVANSIVPRLLSLLMLISGSVLLVSGATPANSARLRWLESLLPLSVIEVSHLLGSIIGTALLPLAYAVYRRLDSAYWISISLILIGMVATLLKGLDFEEAALLAILLFCMIPSRRFFFRRGQIMHQPFSGRWWLTIATIVVAIVGLTLFAFRHIEYRNELWWQVGFQHDVPRSLRAMLGILMTLLAFGVVQSLQPMRRPLTSEPVPDFERLRTIVANYGRPGANLVFTGDKRILMHESGEAFLMYGISGSSWICMGDPIGPPEQIRELAWEFKEQADRFSCSPVFYQVTSEQLGMYIDLGMGLLKIGEEAEVDLKTFGVEGNHRKSLRQSLSRLQREGLVFEVIPEMEVPSLLPKLRTVSDAWLESKNTSEKGFSLGRFDEEYLSRFPVAILRRDEEIVAFSNLWKGSRGQLSVDLMRFTPDAPNSVMEGLFVHIMLWGKENGYSTFDLGAAPLSGLEASAQAPLWNRLGNFIFHHGEQFYNFAGLRAYKEKFHPNWRPIYLASPGRIGLPRVMANLVTLIAGSVRGIVAKS